MPAPLEVVDLLERFRRNYYSYKSPEYNETQVRREFVDPLFEALGWDVNNKQGYAEAYKDVVHEDSMHIAGIPRSPDYSFRVGGTRKFFVETKKPFVNLKESHCSNSGSFLPVEWCRVLHLLTCVWSPD
jgi:predicted type IV restriction endonuclease